MKNFIKLIVGTLLAFVTFISINAQDNILQINANEWFKGESYLGGLKIKPFEGTNITEFYNQYKKNKLVIDKAFAYLKCTNLDTLSVGQHTIYGDSLFARVSQNPTKAFDITKWEFHKKYIDIQYVIRGKEKMGITLIENLKVIEPYEDERETGFGLAETGKYYLADSSVFLIFFPSDAHRPNIKVEGWDKTKKIVLKLMAK